jgi:hypothetical protein
MRRSKGPHSVKIRFLVTTASSRPEYPFRAGQVINVPQPTPEMLAWLTPESDGTVRAEVVPEEAPEAAVLPEPERAIHPHAAKRKTGGWQREETRDAHPVHGS